ncbi:MAG: hypothetical protein NTZ74_00630 [Chloroflexi bacterium]|nr:hypothetical protein [Chloroflexota bacterium]
MNQSMGVEVFTWDQQGYRPLVFFNNWQTAILNWEPIFDFQNLGEVEQHKMTDEVFVLVQGTALLFTITSQGEIDVKEMVPGVIYNVKQGIWHNLVSTKSAKWIIVENRDTHITDTIIRRLSEPEKTEITKKLPRWINDADL